MKAYFYQIENGKVVGGMYGTDIPGDPSSTKAVLDSWAAKAPGRSVKVVDLDKEKPVEAKPELLTVDSGTGNVRGKTTQEIAADDQVKEDEKQQKKDARKNQKRDVLSKLKLSVADLPGLRSLIEDLNDE